MRLQGGQTANTPMGPLYNSHQQSQVQQPISRAKKKVQNRNALNARSLQTQGFESLPTVQQYLSTIRWIIAQRWRLPSFEVMEATGA